MKVVTYEHEEGLWCWCRPKIVDEGYAMSVTHRNIPASSLAERIITVSGESDGDAADWQHRGPNETTAVEV